ncbi:MAG: hypothetical protein R3C18_01590 [Planctomycetaceae bacterium]
MDVLLHGYEVNPPTWFYLSSILILAVYLRFNRWWSLRNLDLLLILGASPGLLFLRETEEAWRNVGYAWLFVSSCLFLIRLLLDPLLQRRPYAGQNMNPQGLAFLCLAAFAFIMTLAITKAPPESTQRTVNEAGNLLTRTASESPAGVTEAKDSEAEPQATAVEPQEALTAEVTPGPAAAVIAAPVGWVFDHLAARILAIIGHAAVIIGLWFVGRNLFADSSLGMGMATLYLLLPCTAYNVGEFNHVLPAALIVWAFVSYRRPIISGILLGFACGTMYFPVLLLPLWAAFYGKKGAGRFAIALVAVAVVLAGSIALTSTDSDSFVSRTFGTVDFAVLAFFDGAPETGFWRASDFYSSYRLPIIVSYFIMLTTMTILPRRRTVETLLWQSAAAIVGAQLWLTQQGGVYLLWYLPLMLMIMFRPRLMQVSFADDPVQLPNTARSNSPEVGGLTNSRAGSQQLFR